MYRIGFDAKRLFNNFTGLGNYSRTLVSNLEYYHPEFAYFLYSPKLKDTIDTSDFLNNPSYSVYTPKKLERPGWRTYGIKKQLKKHKIELYHGLSNEMPLGLSKLPMKVVVSIHDLVFKFYPKQYKANDRLIYHSKTQYACQHADTIIAISESTKRDLIEYYHVPEKKVKVVYQTCASQFLQDKSDVLIEKVKKKYDLPDEYMLYVGSITERKNLLNILKAMKILPKAMELPLVIVGGGKAYKEEVRKYISQHKLEKYIYFIRPSNSDLPFIYQKASFFIYPSLYEGFGIPIIEALFSKTPVITSNCSSMPEAAGPDSLLIDPNSPEAIADAMHTVLNDSAQRQIMVDRGFEYVQQFRGEPLTEQLVEIYQDLLNR